MHSLLGGHAKSISLSVGGRGVRGRGRGQNNDMGPGRGGMRGRGTNHRPGNTSQNGTSSGQFGDEFLGQGGPLSSPPITRARHLQRNVDLNA